MNCLNFENLLPVYSSGELTEKQRSIVESHLTKCKYCKKILEDYLGTKNRLATYGEVQLKPDLKEGVISAIKKPESKSKGQKWLRPTLAAIPALALLTALLVVQPWNFDSSTLLAKVIEASENIKSYRINEYQSDSSVYGEVVSEKQSEFVLPDRIHVTYSESDLYGQETGGEYYVIGNELYCISPQDFEVKFPTITGPIQSRESVLGLLEFIGELPQLPNETADGVECLHFKGSPAWYRGEFELWIGKDDYLPRTIIQRADISNSNFTNIVNYYDYNEDIVVNPPLAESGKLLPGWELLTVKSASSLLTVDEALSMLTGSEDWSDPDTVNTLTEMLAGEVVDPWAYYFGLPDEAKEAFKDAVTIRNESPTVVTSTHIAVRSMGYNDGIFTYKDSDKGLDISITTIEDTTGYDESISMGSIARLWGNAIRAKDPQAYYDALPKKTQKAMVKACQDNFVSLCELIK